MRSPEMQPPSREVAQNPLIITIGDRHIRVPRKETYGIPDIGKAIGCVDPNATRGKLRRAIIKNPNIKPQYLDIGKRHTTVLLLPEEDFVLAVTTITSTIERGKGVETRPNGYTLIQDQAQKADAPKINSFDPQQKIIFLKETFDILSNPDPQYQNKRNAALARLSVMDLTNVNAEELEKSYRKAVNYLLDGVITDYDPSGEIHALLEAGKIIAHSIENSSYIIQSLNRIARVFEGDDRQKILDDIETIRRLIPRKFTEFDKKVAKRIEAGLRDQEIADEFGEELSTIKRSVNRLKHKGMRSSRKSGKMPTKQEAI